MKEPADVAVQIDDRVRLLGAALTLTDYPRLAQRALPHHAHAHARATAQFLARPELKGHAAILTLQHLLERGASLEALFTLGLLLAWPGLRINALPAWVPDGWHEQLWDFYRYSQLDLFWGKHARDWAEAGRQVEAVLTDRPLRPFLETFVGAFDQALFILPTISVPAERNLMIRTPQMLATVLPPPLAWGESPPWPYDHPNFHAHTLSAAVSGYALHLLRAYVRREVNVEEMARRYPLPLNPRFQERHAHWADQFVTLMTAALVGIFLEDHVSPQEADAYVMLTRRSGAMDELPGMMRVLRRYQEGYGDRWANLAAFIPRIPAHLKATTGLLG
jgi:hypothetical protein